MDKKEREIIVAAIGASDGRVTAGDLVSATGLPILCVNRCLNSLAYDCGAHLEVSSDGSLRYLFPYNFAWLYRTSFLTKALRFLSKLFVRICFFLVKFSFGSILFFSLFLVYAICFTVLQIFSVFSNMENAASSMKREFFNLLVCYLKMPNKSGKSALKTKTRMPAFFENCFAFLFGPTDPNAGKEAETWKSIANVIGRNHGVTIPEQVRVWSKDRNYEKFELSVLVRLDGMPLVTESGDILYYFPSLVTLSDSAGEFRCGDYLEEKTWHFSGIASKDLIPVVALALVNLIGCNFIYFWLHALPLLVNKPIFYWGITLLWIYGNTFLLFPLIRIALCAKRNDRITTSNVDRKLLADELQDPKEGLRDRIAASRQMASEMAKQAEAVSLVFTTQKDSLGQFIDMRD